MKSRKLQKNRLLKLATYLRTIPAKLFDIDHWQRDEITENGEVCKTVACACGYGCSIPSFKAAGLKLSPGKKRFYWDKVSQNYMIRFGRYKSFNAIARFFGISYEEAENLFSYSGYSNYYYRVTPKIVARKIENFVARKLREKQGK